MTSLNTFLVASILSIAYADFKGDLSAVGQSASALSSLVDAWSSGDGLDGALSIQNNYDPLSSAVSQLESDSGSASQDEISDNIDGINTLTSSVSGLLNGLASKAGDFSSVGASDIVTSDINGLSSTSADIVSKFLSVNSDDGVKDSLSEGVNSLGSAFSSAISAYSAEAVIFPSI